MVILKFLKTWKRLKLLCVYLIRQGLIPQKIALAVALGCTFGLIPVPFVNTALLVLLAALFGLNQMIIQLVNYLVFPLQIVLFIPYIRLGGWITGNMALSTGINRGLFHVIHTDNIFELGVTYLFPAVLAWSVTAIIGGFLLYVIILEVLRRYLRKRQVQPASVVPP